MHVRLPVFIRSQIEPLLQDWEDFAKTIPHAEHMDKRELRGHAREILLVIAAKLDSHLNESEAISKTKVGGRVVGDVSWARVHGHERCASDFSVMENISEFRALRASVVSHWTEDHTSLSRQELADLIMFDEAIDEAITASLEQHSIVKEARGLMFGAILIASPDPIDLLDLEGKFMYVNQATANLFALEPEEIIGKSTLDLGFAFAPDFQRNLKKVISEHSTYRGTCVHRFASGRGERFEYLLAPVLDEHGAAESAVCIFHDVTERALAEEKSWHYAHHDLLTGLPNRRLFLDRLAQEIKHAKRRSRPLAVLFLDINGFKWVNDSLGHEAGDRLLCQVTARLIECVREDDTVARLGGDEFTVLLTGVDNREDAERVARTIKEALVAPFLIAQCCINISASSGIAFYPEDASSPVGLLKAADQAMYKVKNSSSSVPSVPHKFA